MPQESEPWVITSNPSGIFAQPQQLDAAVPAIAPFDYDEFMEDPADVPEKYISEEQLLENLRYFLTRIVPVAEEAGVKLAIHPDDPPIPEPLGGAARILSTLDHFERTFNTVPSEMNAMLFCQGCVREMGEDVPSAIRRIGSQNKIAYVHFRNIRGTPKSFQEVFVDEGDVDMYEAMQTYREIGFEGPFMMDHTPSFPQGEHPMGGQSFRCRLHPIYDSSGVSLNKSRVFIIRSIAYTDTATCERDLPIPIVTKIEGSRGKSRFIEDPRPACPDLSGTHRDPENRDKREMPLPQRIFMNTPQL